MPFTTPSFEKQQLAIASYKQYTMYLYKMLCNICAILFQAF